jgi:ferritin-like metal-binding protein YciE
MATIDSLTTLLVTEVRDLYDAEKRLTTAIPKMSKKAANRELRTALNHHLKETRVQVRRLEQVFRHLGETPRAKACIGLRGIVQEGNEHLREDFERDDLKDLMIIGSALRVEHYEMAAYMGAISHARLLGQGEIVELLEATLDEEISADKKLRAIGESTIDMDEPADSQPDAQGSGLAGLFGRPRVANRSLKTQGRSKAKGRRTRAARNGRKASR